MTGPNDVDPDDLARETKRVVRHFQRFTADQRANHAASRRLGYRQRQAVGGHFYVHPDIPERGFTTRQLAALAAIRSRKITNITERRPETESETSA